MTAACMIPPVAKLPSYIFGGNGQTNTARLLLTMTPVEKERLQAVADKLDIPMSEVLKRGANLIAAEVFRKNQPKNG